MKPQKLSYEDFLESLRLAPRVSVELVIEDGEGHLLLTKRTRSPFENYWHLPGGFLLKGERLAECCGRIAQEELGIDLENSAGEFVGFFETPEGDPRGHILHYVVKYKVGDIARKIGTGSGVKLFDHLPEKIIPYQQRILDELGR